MRGANELGKAFACAAKRISWRLTRRQDMLYIFQSSVIHEWKRAVLVKIVPKFFCLCVNLFIFVAKCSPDREYFSFMTTGMKLISRLFVVAIAAMLFPAVAGAQRYSVSTNLVEWADLGTVNAEAGVAVAQHISLHAAVRYNNWTFRKGDPADRFTDPYGDTERQFENRKQAYALGFRWWPWYIYSGWWGYVRGQYMEYNRGGILKHTAEEGDAYGVGVGIGYTRMLHKNWNIEFGAGVWGGRKTYTEYRCTNCGSVTDAGTKGFVMPDDVFISLIYIF